MSKKSDNKFSMRFPTERKEQLKRLCQKNGNCSTASIIKWTLDLALDGQSEDDFVINETDSVLPEEVRQGLKNRTWVIRRIGPTFYKIRKADNSNCKELPSKVIEGLKSDKYSITKTESGSYKIRLNKPQVIEITES